MPKHILFLVHGMGRYGAMADGTYKPDQNGWFADCEKDLRDAYDRFIKDTVAGGAKFDDLFVLVRVEYDSILEHFRQAWQTQAQEWAKLGLGKGFIGEVQKFFQGNNSNAFLWTHLADVALYMAPTVRTHVQTHVATQITEALATALSAGDFYQWSVFAHSLGSAVVHDTVGQLAQLSEVKWDDHLGPIPSPRALIMLANVARLLTDNASRVYADTLAPIGAGHPTYYISCAHELDPLTRLNPFLPIGGGWTSPRYHSLSNLDAYYLVPEVVDWLESGEDFRKFADVVPHGFTHYMHQPEVAATVWPLLLAENPANYPGIAPAAKAAYQKDEDDGIKAQVKAKLESALGGLHAADPILQQLLDLLTRIL